MTVGANVIVIFWILFCCTIISYDSCTSANESSLGGKAPISDEDSKSDGSDSNPKEKRMHWGE